MPDRCAATVDFVQGASGSIHSSASLQTGWDSGVGIVGADFDMDCTSGYLTVADGAGTTPYKSDDDPLPLAHKAFLQSITKGRPQVIGSGYADGVKTPAVTLRANESAAEGRPVEC